MATLQNLAAWKDRLIEARLNGVKEIEDQNGERVTYKSDRELAAALAFADSLIAAASNSSPSIIRFSTSKGL